VYNAAPVLPLRRPGRATPSAAVQERDAASNQMGLPGLFTLRHTSYSLRIRDTFRGRGLLGRGVSHILGMCTVLVPLGIWLWDERTALEQLLSGPIEL